MKKFLLIIMFMCCINVVYGQYIYNNTRISPSNIVAKYEGGKLYRGNSTMYSDVIIRFDGTYIYKGNSTMSSDILATYKNCKLYYGKSTYASDIIGMYTSTGRNGQIHYNNNPSLSSIIYNYHDNHVYIKNSSMYRDIMFTTSSQLHPAILLFILCYN